MRILLDRRCSDPTVKAINNAYATGRVRGAGGQPGTARTLELFNHGYNHKLWPDHAMVCPANANPHSQTSGTTERGRYQNWSRVTRSQPNADRATPAF